MNPISRRNVLEVVSLAGTGALLAGGSPGASPGFRERAGTERQQNGPLRSRPSRRDLREAWL